MAKEEGKKVISFHIGRKLHTEILRLQGEALLNGVEMTQQDVMRACVDRGIRELATYHERKVRIARLVNWIQKLKG